MASDEYFISEYRAGSLFRSAEMALCQLFLQSEAAYACVSELGELGLVQFRDLNPSVNLFQRKFVNEVRRCDEMQRKLRYLEKEIRKDKISMTYYGESPVAPEPREMIDLEATFEKLENELKEVNQNAIALQRNFLELTELKHVLRKCHVFLDEAERETSAQINESNPEDQVTLLGDEGLRAGGAVPKLGFVSGVIIREKLRVFERMLWRACRGNVFVRQADIEAPLEDPTTGEKVNKSVFIIFYQGDQLKSMVMKICEGFRATIYPCSESSQARREMSLGVKTRIDDLNIILGQTQDHRHRVLVAAAKNITVWFIKVKKIKGIYHTLNMLNLDVTQKCLIAECWVPVLDLDNIHLALRRGTEKSGSTVPPILNRMDTLEVPPTYNHINKFTKAFQVLIDSYGIASYREMNPAPFTIVTFPFLFAVMFGDIGHGMLMAMFSSWMIIKEKRLGKTQGSEIWNIFFGGRYIIFLMGVFSMYTGLIYNDIFSKSMNLFGSSWTITNKTKMHVLSERKGLVTLDPAEVDFLGYPYPIGMDPIWMFAHNRIIFQNSFKMKVSIILGVTHMLFGVIVSLFNHIYFKNTISIFCEFLPQIIFLCFLFLYMVILMFLKWFIYFASNDIKYIKSSTRCAPSILITFINMMLQKGTEYEKVCETPHMYSGQDSIQNILVLCSLICVPWMLLAKPIIAIRSNKKHLYSTSQQQVTRTVSYEVGDTHVLSSASVYAVQEKEPLSEVFIHQAIHTIEYVLGSVSHTASYLRLWALSLAHAQLSDVLWTMVLSRGLLIEHWVGTIFLYVVFAAWAALTVSILVLMEGMSAFLHTLRLHWVEFQSKFYLGTGYAFQPFSFKAMSSTSTKED